MTTRELTIRSTPFLQTNRSTYKAKIYETKTKQQLTKPMKINKLILICGALAGISIANLSTTHAQSPAETINKDALITWTATGKQSGNVDVLFVQNAKDVKIGRASCRERV